MLGPTLIQICFLQICIFTSNRSFLLLIKGKGLLFEYLIEIIDGVSAERLHNEYTEGRQVHRGETSTQR